MNPMVGFGAPGSGIEFSGLLQLIPNLSTLVSSTGKLSIPGEIISVHNLHIPLHIVPTQESSNFGIVKISGGNVQTQSTAESPSFPLQSHSFETLTDIHWNNTHRACGDMEY